MPKYREIRSRIQGIENTAKITQAMKMVAAAKLRRAQDSIIAARPYAKKLREVLQFLASSAETAISPLFDERERVRVAVVVVSADRGLCGAFNSNVIRAAQNLIRGKYAEYQDRGDVDLYTVGKRASDYFAKRSQYHVVAAYPGIFAGLDYSFARTLVAELSAGFLGKRYDRVDVVYNEFKSVGRQSIAVEQFLPIPRLEESAEKVPTDYIFEPTRDQLLDSLLPKHLNTQMWNVLLESNAAEQGARMAAMENATRNAKDLVKSLRLIYNKARQGAITTEILEIVSGAEALKKG